MKGGPGRKIIEIKDFSGGQVTRPPEKGIESKYSPDCLNVYAEGLKIKKRPGVLAENSTAASGAGNGFYNWVRSFSEQLQVVFFGSTLSKVDVSSGAWDGTLDTISKDSANGTSFSNAIMHFVTYNGVLIMTTENRDKPQYMRVTDSSHFNIEYLGAGTGPYAKYCQVWKNHAWFLNIAAGSLFSEDCASIASWTDNDTGTGASTQTAWEGQSTFRLYAGGTSGDSALRIRDIGSISDNYSFEIKTWAAALSSTAGGDLAEFYIYNGVHLVRGRFSSTQFQIYDGSAFQEVGVNSVSLTTWITYKLVVTGGSASAVVDVYRQGSVLGLQVPCANADTSADGQINLYARAAASGTRADWYVDYIYVDTVSAPTNAIQNPQFETWYPLNGSCATFSTASQSYLQLSDHASFTLGTAFSIEGLLNLATTSTAPVGLYTQSTATSDQIKWHIINGAMVFSVVTGGTTIAYHSTASLTWSTGQWYALMLYRQGTAVGMMRDGQVLSLSATTSLGGSTIPDLSTNIYIGAIAGTAASFTGSLDEFRVSSIARQTAAYHVATSNFSSDANTSLLLHLDSNFSDSSSYGHTITTANGVANATTPLNVATWKASSTITLAREGTTLKQGTYALKMTGTGTVSQTIAVPTIVTGSLAYLAGWIKPPASGTYYFDVTDDTSTFTSETFTGNTAGDWQYQSLPFNSASTSTAVTVRINLITNNTWIADSFALIRGGTASVLSDLSDRIVRTAVGYYNDFTGTDSGYNDIVTPGDIGLTGSFILNDRMYVTKSWSIHRLSYTSSYPLVYIQQVKKTVGTKSPRTVKNVDISEAVEAVLFLGTDRRLYLFDGISPTSISDEMTVSNGYSSVYFDNINVAALDKCWAVVHQEKNWYELFVCIGTATTPNYSIVYDFSLKSFWPMDNRNFLSGDIGDDGNGQRRAYALTSTSGKIELLNSGTSDDGTAINSYWTSVKLGVSQQLTRIDEFEIETAAVTGSTPSFSWRADWETAWVSTTLTANTNNHVFAPGRIDNLIQYRILDNSTTASFALWSINMAERPLGIAK